MSANDSQVGGTHYKVGDKPEHWDLSIMYGWDPFQYQITKYVMRWKTKHQTPERKLEDLRKARHFLDKYIENFEKFLPKSAPTLDLTASQQAMYDYFKTRVWSDDTFSCEGWKANLALFQHRVTKQEIWAADLVGAHAQLTAQGGPGGAAKQASDAGSEPSQGYVDQG